MRSIFLPTFLAASAAITPTLVSAHSDSHLISHKRLLKSKRSSLLSPESNVLQARDSTSSAAAAGSLLSLIEVALQNANQKNSKGTVAAAGSAPPSSSCFPALDFQMPDNVPSDLNNWWCSPDTEYAFMGFSYEVTACEFLCSRFFPCWWDRHRIPACRNANFTFAVITS